LKDALFQDYDKERMLGDNDILEALEKLFPLSRTMHETIDKMRLWAKSRTVAASKEEPKKLDAEKNKDVPKLK
jgi:hypothetical protein